MRSHLVLRLGEAGRLGRVPHWETFIGDKSLVVESFGTGLDEVFRRHGVEIWITAEYPPANADTFLDDELRCGFDRTYRVLLRNVRELPAGLVEDVARHPGVEWVRPGAAASTDLPPISQQASFSSVTGWAADMIRLPFAHAHTKGRKEIKVAILDTGVDLDHEELRGKFAARKDLVDFEGLDTSSFLGDLFEADDEPEDEVGHGTHVAGILGARGERIPEGVSPGCSLIAVRVLASLEQDGRRVGAGLVDNINVGIKWAVDHGADVINMSLGIRHEEGGLPHEEVIDYARRKGVSVVAAAGNDGTQNKYYPGALPGVMAIGAVDRAGQVAPFSSYGARISFLAPGTDILSSFRDGGYAASSGTSQAAPFVSGAVALLKSWALERGRKLGDNQVQYLLKQTAERASGHVHHPKGGYGVINLADAIKLLNFEMDLSE